MSERVKLDLPKKSLEFTIQISGTNLNHYPEYNSHQKYLYEKCLELHESGLGYRRISKWFNERDIKTKTHIEFKHNHVCSILKKGKIRYERNTRTFKPKIENVRLVIQ